jgi:hypothetical protein
MDLRKPVRYVRYVSRKSMQGVLLTEYGYNSEMGR